MSTEAAPRSTPAPASRDQPTVLLVDDDEAFRERLRPVRPIACLDKPIILEEHLKAIAAAI